MTRAFTLRVSAEPPFRELAADVAGKYFETLGGSAAEAEAFRVDVAAGIAALAAPGQGLALEFDASPSGVDVAITCGHARQVVHHALVVLNG